MEIRDREETKEGEEEIIREEIITEIKGRIKGRIKGSIKDSIKAVKIDQITDGKKGKSMIEIEDKTKTDEIKDKTEHKRIEITEINPGDREIETDKINTKKDNPKSGRK